MFIKRLAPCFNFPLILIFFTTSLIMSFLSCSCGCFIAVKEVSLLDKGSQGVQRVYQLEQVRGLCCVWSYVLVLHTCTNWFSNSMWLEPGFTVVSEILFFSFSVCLFGFFFFLFQEIALLSQFEHQNIVQYYGTAKVLLFIFFLFLSLNLCPLKLFVMLFPYLPW